MGVFRDQCPARGAGLSHAHWTRCRPPAPHPNDSSTEFSGRVHGPLQCCHCEETLELESAAPKPEPEPEPEAPAAEPSGDCTVDHNSVKSSLLIGDGGLEWSRCPICGVHVEPRFPPQGVQGKPYERGRGDLTERQRRRLFSWAGWSRYLDEFFR